MDLANKIPEILPNLADTELMAIRHWYNGQAQTEARLSLAIDDPGLLYGATVFTTLRIYDTLEHPRTAWPAHGDRLRQTVAALAWSPPDWSRIEVGARLLAASWPVLRLTLFPDGREWLIGRPLPSDLADRQAQGIAAWLANATGDDRSSQSNQSSQSSQFADQLGNHGGAIEPQPTPGQSNPSQPAEPQDTWFYDRPIPSHKTGNYLPAWLAAIAAQTHGCREAILRSPEGEWLETTTGNLWGYAEGRWWTPPLGRILPGVARSQLLAALADDGQPAGERPWSAAWVSGLEALAYSNSVVELIPIVQVVDGNDRRSFQPTAINHVTKLHQILLRSRYGGAASENKSLQ